MAKEILIQQIERSLAAIREVQPIKINFNLLDFNLGERWIPKQVFEQFLMHLFQLQRSDGVVITYFASVDTFKIEINGYSAIEQIEYHVSPKAGQTLRGRDLVEHALMNTTPYFTYEVRGERKPDNDAIQLANEKIEAIRSKFVEWLREQPEDYKEQLVDMYNNTYNCYRVRTYNGSHMLLPGLDMEGLKREFNIDEIRPAQKDAAWRIIQENGGIMDWQVGSGKTLICVIAAHEMKRMGIRKKPCILALKANVADVVKTYRIAYPGAKVLAPSEQDFDKKNRVRLFHEIKNNDWDCVVMTHDQFGKIPQSGELQKEIIAEEIDNLGLDIATAKRSGYAITRSMLKGLQNRKSNLETKLKEATNRIANKKDEDVEFDEMGIDHLFIDEAHK